MLISGGWNEQRNFKYKGCMRVFEYYAYYSLEIRKRRIFSSACNDTVAKEMEEIRDRRVFGEDAGEHVKKRRH
jgi:hypothetical protein